MGGLLAVGLFACVLVHELAHVLVGRWGGARFAGVTLMIVGGVSEVIDLPRRPAYEAAMAVAGPLASLALAAAAFAGHRFAGAPDLAFAMFYLGSINFALALFNLIPGFPLDGGRVLRSIVWAATHSVERATRISARTGQVVAFVLPLNVLLEQGLALKLGNTDPKVYKFRTCTQNGCVSVNPADDKTVDAIGSADKVTLMSMSAMPGATRQDIEVSRKGFAAARKAYLSGNRKRASWFWRMF